MRAIALTAVLTAFLVAGAQAQALYRWVDKDGKVHYTQFPPPAGAKETQRKTFSGSVVETGTQSYAMQVAVRNFPVTLFTSAECGPACAQAKESLDKRGVPYKEISVGDEKSVDALKRASGKAQVPTLQVGAQALVGYEPGGWKAALDNAGYPASAPVARRAEPAPAEKPRAPAAPAAGPPAEVKLYTSPDCGAPCQEAKALLAERKVAFREIAVTDQGSYEELTKLTGGTTVPVLVVGQSIQRGFDPVQYRSMLEAAAPPAPAAARR